MMKLTLSYRGWLNAKESKIKSRVAFLVVARLFYWVTEVIFEDIILAIAGIVSFGNPAEIPGFRSLSLSPMVCYGINDSTIQIKLKFPKNGCR